MARRALGAATRPAPSTVDSAMAAAARPFRIAHLSDLHCGGRTSRPNLLERAISEINELQPDIVICSGDLTTFGFKHEYQMARQYLDRIDCDAFVVVPGNHDARNVGYVHFEDLFGDRSSVLRKDGVTVVAVDSTEPDLDHGQIGRGRYPWIEEQFARSRPTCGSSCCTTTCCRCRAPGASGTSSTTPGTRSSACSARASTSCSPATSTSPTRGGSRTSSSSTPGRFRRCAFGETRDPVTT